MAAKHEVELFLNQLTLKIKVFGILFLDDEGRTNKLYTIWRSLHQKERKLLKNLKQKIIAKAH